MSRITPITPITIGLLLLTSAACTQTRLVRPLAPGEQALSVGFGGPVTQVGSLWLPLPMVNLGYHRGLIDGLDLEAGAQVTHLVFGVLDLDAGVRWHPLSPSGSWPGLVVAPGLHLMADLSPTDGLQPKLIPTLDLTAWWAWTGGWQTYVGLHSWLELTATRSDGNPQLNQWLPAVVLGQTFGSERWQPSVELKWYLPWVDNSWRGPNNLGLGRFGVVGIFVGLSHGLGHGLGGGDE